jgi:hypothetical protein
VKLTREQALERLRELVPFGDPEGAHIEADGILLDLIDDEEIRAAFDAIQKWYA